MSRYQIERWRTSGDLPRPARRGLGRGRGVASEEPDESTLNLAIALAKGSRRGSRRVGNHAIERLGMGHPVDEHDVRRALKAALDDLARRTHADLGDTDEGWQARHSIAERAAPDLQVISWQELIDAFDGQDAPASPSPDQRRAAAQGFLHALSHGDEALADDVIEIFGLLGMTDAQREELRRVQRDAELRGEDPLGSIAEAVSLKTLRRTAATADIETISRAVQAITIIAAYQTIVLLVGALDLAGSRPDPGPLNRFDSKMIRTLQADPMWPIASTVMLSPRPRPRVRQLVTLSLGVLAAGALPLWEAYRDRLLQLVGNDHDDELH
ncbi:hypothetical protein [Micromonospora sp. 4G55]|uniref:hypothetical protein n=1 Tax=Micromonospora sp. 4G55 TaxID=2806102 RepID=UPI001A4271FC|nr:hypothetical protein [Micromonospora sp. 4G55]MBM0255564.1 hypothetical protein [Micromonospora sp. 4G55]